MCALHRTIGRQAAAKSARLARKAESARESRRRKKSYIQNLEDQAWHFHPCPLPSRLDR